MERRNLIIGIAVILAAVVSAAAVGAGIAASVQTTSMDPAMQDTPTPTPDDGSGDGDGSDGESTATATPTDEDGDGDGDGAGDGTDTETPSDENGDGETSEDVKMLVEASQPSEGVGDNESATFTITLRTSDGEPVEGATLRLQSVGTSGEFDPGQQVETDEDGTATVEWIYHQPKNTEEYAKMPPSEETSIAVQTTVDGNEISEFTTVKLNIDPYLEGCHSEGEDL